MPTKPDHHALWALIVCGVAVVLGIALLSCGIYILAGAGWAALVVSVPFFLLALVIFRGLADG